MQPIDRCHQLPPNAASHQLSTADPSQYLLNSVPQPGTLNVVGRPRRNDLTLEEKENLIADLVREITALWQTDELRRRKPTPLDGAQPKY